MILAKQFEVPYQFVTFFIYLFFVYFLYLLGPPLAVTLATASPEVLTHENHSPPNKSKIDIKT